MGALFQPIIAEDSLLTKFNVFMTGIRYGAKIEIRNSPLTGDLQFRFAMFERGVHGLVGKLPA